MTRRYNGAVRTLEDLRGRCVMDEETGCWHLRDSRGRPLVKTGKDVPKVFLYASQSRESVRRVSWLLAHPGREIPAGMRVALVCGCWDCANPAHHKLMTPAELGALTARDGRAKSTAKQRAGLARSRTRSTTKLTAELAQWARESQQPQRAIAHALGISQQGISDIRAGRRWRAQALVPGASVFAWRPGA